jgi:hypothetical protein
MGAWVLVTARHTIWSMVQVMDPATRRAHDAYHRFVRAGVWSLDSCLAAVCLLAVRWVGTGRLTMYLDDTLFHRTGKKGRPRTKGKRLCTPKVCSTRLRRKAFTMVACEFGGSKVDKLLWSTDVLWHRVSPTAMVRLVIVRDPAGHEPDDYFHHRPHDVGRRSRGDLRQTMGHRDRAP